MLSSPSEEGRARALQIAALLLLFILFTRIADVLDPPGWRVSTTQMAVAVLLTWTLVDTLFWRRSGLVWDRALGCMLLYGAAIGLSLITAQDRLTTAAAVVAYLREVIIVFLLINLITTLGGLQLGIWGLLLGAFCLVLAGIVQAVSGYGLGGLSDLSVYWDSNGSAIRFDGPRGMDSNHFAQLLVCATPLGLCLAWGERRMSLRLAVLGITALLIAACAWSFSRGGLVGLIVVTIMAVLLQGFRKSRILVAGLVCIPMLVSTPQVYWSRIFGTVSYVSQASAGFVASSAQPEPPQSPRSSARPDSLDDRSVLWRVGALMLRERPLTGFGRGSYYALYPEFAPRAGPNVPVNTMGPHNTPVQIAAETGLLGLGAFVTTIVVAVVGLRRARKRMSSAGDERGATLLAGIEVAIYGFLVTSMFLNDNVYQRSLWLLIGLAAAGRQIALSRPESSSSTFNVQGSRWMSQS